MSGAVSGPAMGAAVGSTVGSAVRPPTIRPTSVRLEADMAVDSDPRNEVPHLLEELRRVVGGTPYASSDAVDIIGEAERRLYRRGERIRLIEGDPESGMPHEGILEGLGTDGALLIRTEEGEGEGELHSIISGEFSIRM